MRKRHESDQLSLFPEPAEPALRQPHGLQIIEANSAAVKDLDRYLNKQQWQQQEYAIRMRQQKPDWKETRLVYCCTECRHVSWCQSCAQQGERKEALCSSR